MQNNQEHKIDAELKQWFVDVKKCILNHQHVIMYLVLLVMVAFVSANLFSASWRNFLFVTDKGKFQWVGVSAAGAGLGLVINAIDNRKKIKADLVSKSRITWISSMRDLCAEYAACAREYKTSFQSVRLKELQMFSDEGSDQEIYLDYAKTKDNHLQIEKRFKTIAYKMQLNISEAEDNAEMYTRFNDIKENIEIFRTRLNDVENLYEYIVEDERSTMHADEFEKSIQAFLETGRKYFKKEWDKSKEIQ